MRRRVFNLSTMVVLVSVMLLAVPSAARAQSGDVKAAYAHLYRNANVENDLSKLAQKHSQSADVKGFAKQVISENRDVAGEMMAYAVKFNFRLVAEVPQSTKDAEKKMKSLSGQAFDKIYLVQMDAFVKDDQKVSAQLSAMSDPDASAMGTKVQNAANDRAKQISKLTLAEGFQIQ